MEHRIQLQKMRRTHLVPDDAAGSAPARPRPGLSRRARSPRLTREWKRHAMEVRRLHEKLFYRPLLDAVAQLDSDETRLSTDAARSRLQALGYADPAAAIRHLEALASGVSRKAAIQRTLLPVLLGWFADSADPDAGLLGFRKVSDALGKTPWYLRLLRDEGATAQRLARVLSSGRFAPDLLMRAPEAVAMLGSADGLEPREHGALEQEVLAAVGRADSPGAGHRLGARGAPPRAVPYRGGRPDRHLRRRRGLRRPAGPGHPGRPGRHRRLRADRGDTRGRAAGGGQRGHRRRRPPAAHPVRRHRHGPASAAASWPTAPTPTCCSCTSRYEGADSAQAARAALAVADELRRLLQIPTADPPLLIDADLRPEGKSGPMVRSLASYAAYYRRWSLGWESQALLRAHPVAGDPGLGERFIALVDPLRYPADGLDDEEVREIRRLKARMESERMPRGADRTPTPSWAAAGWPTWSGPCSCSSSGTPPGCPRCAPPAPARRWPPRRAAGLIDADGRPRAGRGVGAGHPGAQRGDAGTRPARRHLPRRRARAGRGRPLPRLPARATSATCWRTTGAAPAGPARWWTGCSTRTERAA